MKPFLKWAGGKRQIIDTLISYIKGNIDADNKDTFYFIEPFVGGGVVFLTLNHPRTIINDLNRELIATYQTIKQYPDYLMDSLDKHQENYNKDPSGYYYNIRKQDREEGFDNWSNLDLASRMIFLNKTCFNGLYRVNSEGYFNVPIGRGTRKTFYNKKDILDISKYLKNNDVEIMCGSYKKAARKSQCGDIVYFDPPYDYEENDGFTQYQKEGFSFEDLKELKVECDSCLDRESYVIISNNNTKKVRNTFEKDPLDRYKIYTLNRINTKRIINCKGDNRNNGDEIIIIGKPLEFPKVNDLNSIIPLIKVRDVSKLNDFDWLKQRFGHSERNLVKCLKSLQYIGLINENFKITEQGQLVRRAKGQDLANALKESIAKSKYFEDAINGSLNIEEISVQSFMDRYNIRNEKLARRRIKLITNWINWIKEHQNTD